MPWTSWISIKLLQHEQLYISNQQPCFIRHSARRNGGLEREKRAKNLGCWKTFGLYGVEGMSKCGSLKYRLRNNHFILYTLFVLCHFYANTARICTTFAIKKVKGNMWQIASARLVLLEHHMTLVPPLLSTSACSSLVGLSQTAYRCSYYGDGYSWATKDWGYFLPSTPQQSQVKSSKCSRQEANNTSNLERVLQCSHTLGVFKQNDTNIFLFQHTMCQRAPRQLMKWDLAHFLWSWKARAGQHRHICKILQVHHGTTGLRRLLLGKCSLWSYAPLGLLRSLSSPSLNVSTKFQDVYFNIISVLFQWHMEGLCTKLAQFVS